MKRLLMLFSAFFIFTISCSVNNSSVNRGEKFTNPILAGFYPDPSVCRVGDDYYLVNSTFAYFPGIPVFQSKDLVNWQLIGHVMDRPEQMDTNGFGVSRGIFAPAIMYHNNLFYVTCTLVDGGGNFVVTSKTAGGPWSNPVWIPEINGIDPSMYFDEDGKAYIIYNSVAPNDKPLYEGHRTIRMYEFDLSTLKVTRDEKLLINGGTDISKKPIWIEAPHIFKKDGFYYLICAEGGTADDHSEVVFRSKKIDGPYISYEKNPILTQRHLDPKRNNPITSTGHADFVETQNGDWWAVFLGCRPYPPLEKGYYNIGRETFLAPVKWENGWPVINPDYEEIQYYYPYPLPPQKEIADRPYSGNFQIRDDFDKEVLNPDWIFLRTPNEKWYDLKRKSGYLSIRLRPETCAGKKNPGFIGRRQQHTKGSIATLMNFIPQSGNEKAGLLVFQNENHYYYLCKSMQENIPAIQLFQSAGSDPSYDGKDKLLAVEEIDPAMNEKEVYLKIESDDNLYSFFYALYREEWIPVKENVDATFLRAVIPKDFAGCIYALYATSLGVSSETEVYYDWVEYKNDESIYKQIQ